MFYKNAEAFETKRRRVLKKHRGILLQRTAKLSLDFHTITIREYCIFISDVSTSNAVKIQLWVAICTYLIVAIIKAKCESDYSITEVEMLLRVSVFERLNIRDLLTKQQINYSIKNQISKN